MHERVLLRQNYPNPFASFSTVSYDLLEATNVRLVVHDALGRLVDDFGTRYLTPGTYSDVLDAARLPSGVYVYTLTSGSQSTSKCLLVTK